MPRGNPEAYLDPASPHYNPAKYNPSEAGGRQNLARGEDYGSMKQLPGGWPGRGNVNEFILGPKEYDEWMLRLLDELGVPYP